MIDIFTVGVENDENKYFPEFSNVDEAVRVCKQYINNGWWIRTIVISAHGNNFDDDLVQLLPVFDFVGPELRAFSYQSLGGEVLFDRQIFQKNMKIKYFYLNASSAYLTRVFTSNITITGAIHFSCPVKIIPPFNYDDTCEFPTYDLHEHLFKPHMRKKKNSRNMVPHNFEIFNEFVQNQTASRSKAKSARN